MLINIMVKNKSKSKTKKGKTQNKYSKRYRGGIVYNPRTNFTHPDDEANYTNNTPGINDDYYPVPGEQPRQYNQKKDNSSIMYFGGGALAVAGLGIGGYFLFKK
jgi:hypothetical protein